MTHQYSEKPTDPSESDSDRLRTLLDNLNNLRSKLKDFTVIDELGQAVGEITDLMLDEHTRQLNLIVSQATVDSSTPSVLLNGRRIKKVSVQTQSVFVDITQADLLSLPKYSASAATSTTEATAAPITLTAPIIEPELPAVSSLAFDEPQPSVELGGTLPTDHSPEPLAFDSLEPSAESDNFFTEDFSTESALSEPLDFDLSDPDSDIEFNLDETLMEAPSAESLDLPDFDLSDPSLESESQVAEGSPPDDLDFGLSDSLGDLDNAFAEDFSTDSLDFGLSDPALEMGSTLDETLMEAPSAESLDLPDFDLSDPSLESESQVAEDSTPDDLDFGLSDSLGDLDNAFAEDFSTDSLDFGLSDPALERESTLDETLMEAPSAESLDLPDFDLSDPSLESESQVAEGSPPDDLDFGLSDSLGDGDLDNAFGEDFSTDSLDFGLSDPDSERESTLDETLMEAPSAESLDLPDFDLSDPSLESESRVAEDSTPDDLDFGLSDSLGDGDLDNAFGEDFSTDSLDFGLSDPALERESTLDETLMEAPSAESLDLPDFDLSDPLLESESQVAEDSTPDDLDFGLSDSLGDLDNAFGEDFSTDSLDFGLSDPALERESTLDETLMEAPSAESLDLPDFDLSDPSLESESQVAEDSTPDDLDFGLSDSLGDLDNAFGEDFSTDSLDFGLSDPASSMENALGDDFSVEQFSSAEESDSSLDDLVLNPADGVFGDEIASEDEFVLDSASDPIATNELIDWEQDSGASLSDSDLFPEDESDIPSEFAALGGSFGLAESDSEDPVEDLFPASSIEDPEGFAPVEEPLDVADLVEDFAIADLTFEAADDDSLESDSSDVTADLDNLEFSTDTMGWAEEGIEIMPSEPLGNLDDDFDLDLNEPSGELVSDVSIGSGELTNDLLGFAGQSDADLPEVMPELDLGLPSESLDLTDFNLDYLPVEEPSNAIAEDTEPSGLPEPSSDLDPEIAEPPERDPDSTPETIESLADLDFSLGDEVSTPFDVPGLELVGPAIAATGIGAGAENTTWTFDEPLLSEAQPAAGSEELHASLTDTADQPTVAPGLASEPVSQPSARLELPGVNGASVISGEFKSTQTASQVMEAIATTLRHRCKSIRIEVELDDKKLQKAYQDWLDECTKL